MTTKLNAPRGADFILNYIFPTTFTFLGYSAVFNVYTAQNGATLLSFGTTASANGSQIAFTANACNLLMTLADLDGLPVDAEDSTNPALLQFDLFITSPSNVTSKIHGGLFIVRPFGSPNTTNGTDFTVTLDGTDININLEAGVALTQSSDGAVRFDVSQSLAPSDTAQARTNIGLSNIDNTSDADKPISNDTVIALATKEPTIAAGTTAQYWRGDKTWQSLTKSSVGLGNVDNTSDVNKPVSSATTTALAGKEPTITAGTTSQYWRGDKTWQTLSAATIGLTSTDSLSEGASNLYYTNTRADGRIQAVKGSATPLAPGTAAAGSSSTWAPIDHVHPNDTTKASLTGATFTGTITVPLTQINAAAGTNRRVDFLTSGVRRWLYGANSTSESGSNAGSDLVLYAVADDGATNTLVYTVNRASGVQTYSVSPAGPTPSTADNSTTFATTAYVKSNLSNYATTASLASYAPLSSPALTGTPTAPTASTATNTTQIATTAYVKSNLASYATLASPALTGSPTAPTQTAGDNSTKIATTAYADTGLALKANIAGQVFTGGLTVPSSKVDGAAGTNRRWDFTTANVRRWLYGANSTAESGSNAGSDLVLYAVADDGTTNTLVYTVTRSTGVMAYSISPTVPTATAGDNSTKVASTAFVQTATGGQVWGNIHYVNGGVPSDIGLANIYVDTSGTATPQAYTQNYTSSSSMTGGAAVQGVQIYGTGTMAPATPNSGMAESNFIRTNHTIGATAGKQFHWHTFNTLVTTSNDASGSDGPDGVTEGAVWISTWRATGPTSSGAPIGGWCADLHNEKYPSVLDGKMVIAEMGMHKSPALGSARNRGIDLWSGPRSGASPATRAGEAVRVGGTSGWTYFIRCQHTDDTTDIFRVDQNGNIVQTVPAGNYTNLVQTSANSTNLTYQQVAKDGSGTQFSGVMQTTGSAVIFGSASGSAIGTYLMSNGTTRCFADASGNFRPASDNAYTLGSSGNRWSVVYAATGTINTSDARDKEVVGDLSFATDMLKAVDPVLFKWKDGGSETVQTGTRKVKTGNMIPKLAPIEKTVKKLEMVGDVMTFVDHIETLYVEETGEPVQVFNADGSPHMIKAPKLDDDGQPINDENGEPIIEETQMWHKPPVLIEEEIDEPIFETTTRPGSRSHAGFLAQDVRAAMEASGVDFGAWGLDDPNDPESGQWVRPDQLVAVLWQANKDLLTRIEKLESLNKE